MLIDSEKIALFLRSTGNIDKPVPIFMKKSCAALKVIMGIIRAGACYCMIDPMLPQKRIKSMLDTLQSPIIIVGTGVKKEAGVITITAALRLPPPSALYTLYINRQIKLKKYIIKSMKKY